MKSKTLISALILYFASTGASFATFSYLSPRTVVTLDQPVRTQEGGLAIDPGEPKTEICPMNGQKFTKTEKAVWEKRRPLAVMIENHIEARPQSGLSKADIVYEAIAEGGITRFMAVFYCDAVAKDVLLAPVRSARTYFLDWASEYGEFPIYAHVGGANLPGPADALGQIQKYGWRLRNDIDGLSIGLPVYKRDANRLGADRDLATEHTMTSSTEKLWAEAAKRKFTNTTPEGDEWTDSFEAWAFDEETTPEQRGTTKSIAFDFWDGFKQYDALWEYDSTTNVYKRSTGGEAHLDLNTKTQMTTKNIVVQFTKEKGPIDEAKHMLYTTIDKGNILVFKDGQVLEGRWSKANRTARTKYTDLKGKEIKFTRGNIWVEVVAPGTEVRY